MGGVEQSRGSFGKPRALVGATGVEVARREEFGAATRGEAKSRKEARSGDGEPQRRSEPGRRVAAPGWVCAGEPLGEKRCERRGLRAAAMHGAEQMDRETRDSAEALRELSG